MANSSFTQQGATPNNGISWTPGKSNVPGIPGATISKPFVKTPKPVTATPTTPKPATSGLIKPTVQTQSKPFSNSGMISGTFTQQKAPVGPAQGTPQYYANAQEQYNKNISNLGQQYSDRIYSPYNDTGIAEGQKRLSDYELGRANFLLNTQEKARAGNEPLLAASQPKTLGPTDYAYNPLGGAQAANQGAGSVQNRVFNAGQLGAIQNQGAQSVGLQQAQNTISGIKNLLGNDPQTQFAKINQIIANFKNNVSDPSIASFRTTLGALSQAVQPYNATLAQQLSDFTGADLGNQNATAITTAIGQAQNAIQAQQQAVQGNVQNNSAGGGNNVVQTSVGAINTDW